jgi:aconitate hydratase
MGADAREAGWPLNISRALIGSCTNSSYEDITRTADLARQARAACLRVKTPLLVTPGSQRIHDTIARDGLLDDLEAIGATVLANACGPCIGQWQRDDVHEGDVNVIINSYNRNFPKRNDGLASTLAFVTSPETVMAYALAGTLDFNPLADEIDGVRLQAPHGEELPVKGYEPPADGFVAPPPNAADLEVVVRPDSDRLQLLAPFAAWDGQDFIGLPVLLKAKGKCTTDHISAAGRWLAYRGHLENISGNLFLGVVNAYTGEAGFGTDPIDGERRSFPDIAKHLSEAGQPWVAVGDENYGEGSSREHAAMEPRYRGAKAIFARSFARIHETNLKKQGLLPLTFSDPATYDRIGEQDRISVLGLAALAPDTPVACRIEHPDGSSEDFTATQTFSPDQIEWFRAGGALNLIRARQAGR